MRLLAAIVALAAIPAIAADPITGKVVSVTDGDTVRVLDAANVQHKVRLDGIDAPERGQPFGTVARDRLAGAEREARAAKPVPPWEWRATAKGSQAAACRAVGAPSRFASRFVPA